MTTCPICGSELTRRYEYRNEYGIEESKDECYVCYKYSEIFSYGNTEIEIGDFSIGYSFSFPESKILRIREAIANIGNFYRIGIQS